MRRERVITNKTHFKMYKDGRRWVIAGLSFLSIALVDVAGNAPAHADTATQSTTEQPTGDSPGRVLIQHLNREQSLILEQHQILRSA